MNMDQSTTIQCPGCKRRFALPAGTELPEHFHCSLCDALFDQRLAITESQAEGGARANSLDDAAIEEPASAQPVSLEQLAARVDAEQIDAEQIDAEQIDAEQIDAEQIDEVQLEAAQLEEQPDLIQSDSEHISDLQESADKEDQEEDFDIDLTEFESDSPAEKKRTTTHILDEETLDDVAALMQELNDDQQSAAEDDARESETIEEEPPSPPATPSLDVDEIQSLIAQTQEEQPEEERSSVSEVASQVYSLPDEDEQASAIEQMVHQVTEEEPVQPDLQGLQEQELAPEARASRVSMPDADEQEQPTERLSRSQRESLIQTEEQLDLGLGELAEQPTLVDDISEQTTELPEEESLESRPTLSRLEREQMELAAERNQLLSDTLAQEEQTIEAPLDSSTEVFSDYALSGRHSRVKSLPASFLFVPIFLFLGLLGGAGYFLSQGSNQTARQIADLLTSRGPQVAPAGLRIRHTRFKRVELLSGDTVPVITGTLYNDSTKTLKSIFVEGILFDDEGKLQRQFRVSADALSGDLQELTVDMIRAQQRKQPGKRFALAPGASHTFTIALTGSEVSRSSFYSARVYSVKS